MAEQESTKFVSLHLIKGVGVHLMNRYALRQYSSNALCLFWSFNFNHSDPLFSCTSLFKDRLLNSYAFVANAKKMG